MGAKISIARLIKELPEDYEDECEKQGAVSRWRGIKNAADLMLLVLFHLMNGTSLLEIAVVAKKLNIGNFSDVAFMKRLAKCTDWFSRTTYNPASSKALLNRTPLVSAWKIYAAPSLAGSVDKIIITMYNIIR